MVNFNIHPKQIALGIATKNLTHNDSHTHHHSIITAYNNIRNHAGKNVRIVYFLFREKADKMIGERKYYYTK